MPILVVPPVGSSTSNFPSFPVAIEKGRSGLESDQNRIVNEAGPVASPSQVNAPVMRANAGSDSPDSSASSGVRRGSEDREEAAGRDAGSSGIGTSPITRRASAIMSPFVVAVLNVP